MKIPQNEINTSRLLLRRWRVEDVPLLAGAIEASIPELKRWTPWVIPDAPALDVLQHRLIKFSQQFDAGEHFIYGIFDPSVGNVIGQVGLYGRIGPEALEIGYFIASHLA